MGIFKTLNAAYGPFVNSFHIFMKIYVVIYVLSKMKKLLYLPLNTFYHTESLFDTDIDVHT